jgi:hypothetical protein
MLAMTVAMMAAVVVAVGAVAVEVVAVVVEAVAVAEHDQVAMTASGVKFLTSEATWAKELLVTGRFSNS